MARITDFSELFKFAHSELPRCPSALFNQAIVQSGRKFCEKSRVWREDLTPYDLVEDQKEYTLAPITGGTTYVARIDCIVEVRWNSEDGVDNGDKGQIINWRDYKFNPNTNVLTFDQAPSEDVTSGLEVRVILVPQLNATDMTDWVLNRYAEAIIAGAMYDLKKQPGKDWTDLVGAAAYRNQWFSGIGNAKADIAAQFRDGNGGQSDDRTRYYR